MTSVHRPSILERVIAVFIGLLACNQGWQALGARSGQDPRPLVAEYVAACVTGLLAAYGIWRGRRWGPWAFAVNGATMALLVLSLGPLLSMDPAARGGLWIGAASIAVPTAAGVWYIQRRVRRSSM
ncbi:MAG: hypothetical protein ABR607_17095, partial [Pyrinomonadaceae bacterium]